jgi:hypothetical protein
MRYVLIPCNSNLYVDAYLGPSIISYPLFVRRNLVMCRRVPLTYPGVPRVTKVCGTLWQCTEQTDTLGVYKKQPHGWEGKSKFGCTWKEQGPCGSVCPWYGPAAVWQSQYLADCTTGSNLQPTTWYIALHEALPVVSWKGESTVILNSSNLRHEVMAENGHGSHEYARVA